MDKTKPIPGPQVPMGTDGESASADTIPEKMAELLPPEERVTFDDDGIAAELTSHTRFEVTRRLGAGGMGVIYRAKQQDLEREVALKQMQKHIADFRRAKASFVAEARVTGGLSHPNIVPVHDLISEGEDVTMAMKLVDGLAWDELLKPRKPEARQRARSYTLKSHLEILITLCNPVAFAHSHGIVHCDLKPANVMLGDFGEILLMDWGLAVVVSEHSEFHGIAGLRHPDELKHSFGTPGYMAPEMARGDGSRLDARTDVYLLGAILFELITGKSPHSGDSAEMMLRASREHLINPLPEHIAPELRHICLKALSKDPEDRYRSALAFAEALEGYLSHAESIRIEEDSRQRFAKLRSGESEERAGTGEIPYKEYVSIVAALDQALVIWPDNEPARALQTEVRFCLARLAREQGDFGAAKTVLGTLKNLGEDTSHESARLQEAAARASILERRGLALKRMMVTAIFVVLLAVMSGGYLYFGMRSVGDDIAQDVYTQLLEVFKKRLTQVTADASKKMTDQMTRTELAASEVGGVFKSRLGAVLLPEEWAAHAQVELGRTVSPDNPQKKEAFARLNSEVAAGRGGFVEMPYKGEHAFLAYAPLEGTDHYLLIIMPRSYVQERGDAIKEAISHETNSQLVHLGVTSGGGFLAILAIILLVSRGVGESRSRRRELAG